MYEFLAEYGLFFAKVLTIVVAVVIIIGTIVAASQKAKSQGPGSLAVTKLNELYEDMRDHLEEMVLPEHEFKAAKKDREKARKRAEKSGEHRPRVFALSFEGDVEASQVDLLREEVTALLTIAKPGDEIVLNLESLGGMVHTYGLAAAQLQRIKDAGITLTICVDRVAASGGYMMACIADHLYAAPFAIIGSIGVLAQIPNVNRLLTKHDVDYEILTAGEHKQSMSFFAHNTDKMRQKLVDDLQDTHHLFKSFVSKYRPQLDINLVATGEIWYGQRAVAHGLVDGLMTSDTYLFDKSRQADVYRVEYQLKQSLQEKLGLAVQQGVTKSLAGWQQKANSMFVNRF